MKYVFMYIIGGAVATLVIVGTIRIVIELIKGDR